MDIRDWDLQDAEMGRDTGKQLEGSQWNHPLKDVRFFDGHLLKLSHFYGKTTVRALKIGMMRGKAMFAKTSCAKEMLIGNLKEFRMLFCEKGYKSWIKGSPFPKDIVEGARGPPDATQDDRPCFEHLFVGILNILF
jgi:hypothetical protein